MFPQSSPRNRKQASRILNKDFGVNTFVKRKLAYNKNKKGKKLHFLNEKLVTLSRIYFYINISFEKSFRIHFFRYSVPVFILYFKEKNQ